MFIEGYDCSAGDAAERRPERGVVHGRGGRASPGYPPYHGVCTCVLLYKNQTIKSIVVKCGRNKEQVHQQRRAGCQENAVAGR